MIPIPLIALVLVGVPVAGDGTCPAPSEVEALVGRLSPDTAPPGSVARLQTSGEVVHLSLRDAQGTVLFERDLPTGRPCDQLAEIAALFLVGWLSEPPPQVSEAERLPPPAPPPSPAPWRWELGAGASGSLLSTGAAPGARLEVEAGPRSSRFALSLFGLYDGPREVPLGPGKVQWQSVELGLGPTWALINIAPLRLEVGADLTLTDVLLQGRGFQPNGSASALDPGLDAGGRVVVLQGAWHVWLGLWVDLWFQQEFPEVSGQVAQTALPRLEGLLGLGGSYSL